MDYPYENYLPVADRSEKKQNTNKKTFKKKLYGPFLWKGFNYLKARATSRGQFTFYQKFLVLILSTSEVWKAESTLEPPSSFEHETPGLGIQRLNH